MFAYLGPQPVPFLPLWEPLVWDNAVRDIAISHLPCNWLQCQENSLDPVHFEWAHSYWGQYVQQGPRLQGRAARPADAPEDRVRRLRARRREASRVQGYTEEDDDGKHGHPVFVPNILLVGSEVSVTMQFRVPIDDENTLHVSLYTWRGAPGQPVPKQESVPYREVPLLDENGRGSWTWCSTRTTRCGSRRGPSRSGTWSTSASPTAASSSTASCSASRWTSSRTAVTR